MRNYNSDLNLMNKIVNFMFMHQSNINLLIAAIATVVSPTAKTHDTSIYKLICYQCSLRSSGISNMNPAVETNLLFFTTCARVFFYTEDKQSAVHETCVCVSEFPLVEERVERTQEYAERD